MQPPVEHSGRTGSGLRRRWRWPSRRAGSIRSSLLAIAIVPCLVLFISGAIAITSLADNAVDARRWVSFIDEQRDPLLGFIRALEDERLASVAVLHAGPRAEPALQAKRAQTDNMLAAIAGLTPRMEELIPQAISKSAANLAEAVAGMPAMRQAVDRGQTDGLAVDNLYSRLAAVAVVGYESSAAQALDATVATETMTVANLMRMVEFHSRAVAAAAATAGDRAVREDQQRLFAYLVGAYREQLGATTTTMTDNERARLSRLTETAAWRTATFAEDTLAGQGELPIPYAEWITAARAVNDELFALFTDHVEYVNDTADASADRALHRSIWVGVGMSVVGVAVFLMALLVANRLVRRLRSLESRSMELANVTLPSIIQRMHDGQQVDVEAEATILDSGNDEIGQVAAAFDAAQRVAMSTAASEAQTRAGFNKVFLDIARRSQVVVRRQLEVLDAAEAKQEDPEHLELLFQLDHLATRARRNAENLLILGGGNAGRRWRDPVLLEHVVRSAVSETEDLSRVSAIRLPRALVLGNAVADLVHLLAELIDNAVLFSPPQSMVSIHGNLVGRGVVVEVEDQGLGMKFEERERLNELLRDPPDFQEMALSGQRHLGLFVVGRLARRHSISVQLQDSAYGGVKAIVLIPAPLLELDVEDDHGVATTMASAHVLPAFDTTSPTRERSTPSAGHSMPQLPPWPGDGEVTVIDDNSSPTPAPQPTHGSRRPLTINRAGGGTDHAAERGKRAPLPKRSRQSHLAPQLREEDPPAPIEPDMSPPPSRSAHDIRRSMQSFQRGTHQARIATAAHPPRTTDGPPT